MPLYVAVNTQISDETTKVTKNKHKSALEQRSSNSNIHLGRYIVKYVLENHVL